MKKYTYILLITITLTSCFKEKIPEQKFYSEEFKWSITIPEGFKSRNQIEIEKSIKNGKKLLEKANNLEIEENVKSIFNFKKDKTTYFESNYEAYNEEVNGSFIENFKVINDYLFQTYRQNMPDLQIDTSFSTELIDDLLFQKSKFTIHFDEKTSLKTVIYIKLFDDKQMTISIVFTDELMGTIILDAIRNSKFD